MNFLVTGGAGFIGSHLCERLVREGHRVCCLDSFNEYYSPALKWDNISALQGKKNFAVVVGDILDSDLVSDLFRRGCAEVVVHLAARAGPRPSIESPFLYEEVNVNGTLVLLEAARRYGAQCFVFASSSSVYGRNEKRPFAESDALTYPVSPYAATKIAGEALCRTYAHLYGIPTTVLRFFTVYGPRQRPDMAIHKFAKRMVEGKEIEIYGDGTSVRDYTYIDDVIDAICAVVERKFSFEIFNLGCSRPVVLNDVVAALERHLGVTARVVHVEEQPGDVPATHSDITKSQRMFGYSPRVDLETGLARFAQWFKEKHSAGLV